LFFPSLKKFKLNYFVNLALTQSEYVNTISNSTTADITGNDVEFVPEVNLKTGINFGYKNLLASIQYTYVSSQFTDATNEEANSLDLATGIVGPIPSYDILDISASYTIGKFKLEAGINNALDNSFFTRRSTGYPGPGIIPSDGRSFYFTLGIKI